MDLSGPEGSNVNDGIDPTLCSLSYISIDVIEAAILCLGRGTLIAKTDIKHAYREVPAHPQDRPLLGMQWELKGLLHGYHAAIWSALSCTDIHSSCRCSGVDCAFKKSEPHFHYIDDFVVLGPPNSEQC